MAIVVAIALIAAGAWFFLVRDKGSGNDPTASSPRPKDTTPVEPHDYLQAACDLPADWVKYIYRGWAPGSIRNYDLSIVPHPPNYMGSFINTSHSGPYDFLQEIPLTLYGPGFVKPMGHVTLDREVTIADIAPTAAQLIGFDFSRPQSSPITEVLEPTSRRPKLVVTAVIDGGGWNVLNKHPDSWPNLKALMDQGTNIDNAVSGSSPSITPAIHTNIGTGTFPRQHGVTAIVVRADDGALTGAFTQDDDDTGVSLVDPTINLRETTLADEYDLSTGNEAKVALISPGTYQLGMIGHGAALDGADHDISPMLAKAKNAWGTNPAFYDAPSYINNEVVGPDADLEAVDRSDGEADGKWREHEVGPVVSTPAMAPWEDRIIKAVIENEDFGADDTPDILSINYKAPDSLGHIWNMISPEEADTLESVDTAISNLINILNTDVGEGEYVLIITADHGQTPLHAGGWPINRSEIRADIDARFDRIDNDTSLLEQTSASSFFMRGAEMRKNKVTPEQVSAYLDKYTIGDNTAPGADIPSEFDSRQHDLIFDAVIPGRQITKVAKCTGALRS